MFPQTDKSWCDYRALNQNWSYQPTLKGRAIPKRSIKYTRNRRFVSQLLHTVRKGAKVFLCRYIPSVKDVFTSTIIRLK